MLPPFFVEWPSGSNYRAAAKTVTDIHLRGADAKPFEEVQPWNQKGEVTVTRIPGLVIGGMPAHGYAWTYTFDVAGQTITGNEKLYVGVQTGLPLRDVTEGSGSTITFDYYDYGAKITITPPCG
jgi:hypothetical protein